jgi:2-desacetyl-2-hydroxyethyl bacteriochlorophyllide A dehydrogenase
MEDRTGAAAPGAQAFGRTTPMKIAVLHGPGDLRLDDAQRPVAGPGDVVMKVAAAGICGTDITYNQTGGPGGPREAPLPLGHEFAGELIEVGPQVKSFKVGDRVAYNSFNSPADFGRGGDGGFSEYVVLRDVEGHTQSLCPVPDHVSLDHAALVEPISVAMHAVNRADPKPGESVALFGAGPIGLGVIVALRWRGIEDIAVFDLSELRRERALALGARAAFDPRETPPAEALGSLRGHGRLFGREYPLTDVYIEATGAQGVLSDIANFCNKGSRIVTVAIQKKPVAIEGSVLMAKELTLMGSLGYPSEFPQVMAKLASGEVDPEMMISHRFPFADFMQAFRTASTPSEAAKVLLRFD